MFILLVLVSTLLDLLILITTILVGIVSIIDYKKFLSG